MQETKQKFPGNTISGGVFRMAAFALACSSFVLITEGEFHPEEVLGINGSYFVLVALGMVATLSYQHKAVFTKKAGENKVHFWKQFTPYLSLIHI